MPINDNPPIEGFAVGGYVPPAPTFASTEIHPENEEALLALRKRLIELNTLKKERESEPQAPDMVNHPPHYTSHPSGVECIQITRHYLFPIGNAIKYLWRAGLKDAAEATETSKEIEDLEKAIWYIQDRIRTLKGEVK